MTAQQHQPTATATTDALGNCTFTFPPPAAQNLAVQGTVAVNGGQAGTFNAHDSTGIQWGTWSGSQPYGPITLQANITLTVDATGLSPNTQYQAQFLGVADYVELLDASMPTALGASSLVGTDAIVNLPAAQVPAGSAYAPPLQYFPCINFAALRLAAVLASGGPVTIECFWSNGDVTAEMGYRRFVVGATAPKLQVVVPHLGDQLALTISNQAASVPPALTDASGNGLDGTFIDLPNTTFGVAGLVAGDLAITYEGAGAGAIGLGSAPVNPGFLTAGDWWLACWIDAPPGASNGNAIRLTGATSAISFGWHGPLLECAVQWNGLDSETPSTFFVAAGSGPHLIGVTYNSGADQFQFWVDGVASGFPIAGAGHGAVDDPDTLTIGQGTHGGTAPTFDELGYGNTLPGVTEWSDAFTAAATSFAAWNAEMLGVFIPAGFYHLNDVPAGTDATLSLCATHTTQPLAMFGGFDIDNAISTPVPDGTTVTALAPPFVFGGPAVLYFNPSGASSGYTMRLQAQEPTGAWNDLIVRTEADGGRQQIDLFVPAQPIRLRVTNSSGSDQNIDAALMVDLHRVG